MSDEKGPVWRRTTPVRGVTNRDVYISKHDAVPEEFGEEQGTGRIDITPDELQRIRARRPTPERIARLETKHDALALDVAEMKGTLGAIHSYAVKADAERERRSAADAKERERQEQVAASKLKAWPAIIKAVGVALALVIAAIVGRSVA